MKKINEKINIIKRLQENISNLTVEEIKQAQDELCKLECVEGASCLYMVIDDLEVITADDEVNEEKEQSYNRMTYIFEQMIKDIEQDNY
jgi:hypothetical protein